MRRFFTGGTSELDDITNCSIPAMHEGTVLDKTNLHVIPSGNVFVKFNVVQQCQNFARMRLESEMDKINAGKLLSRVDDVLSQFKEARERMIQARAVCS